MTVKKKKSIVGRKTVMTESTIRKLEECFSHALTDEQACIYVGIGKQTLYDYCMANPKFRTKKEELKKRVDIQAKMNLVRSIVRDHNIQDSKWWSERKNKDEFSLRVENTGKDGKDLAPPIINILPMKRKEEVQDS